ncbi:hypothetical protein SDC9_08726 [bioreactor metagenome]|uniref:SIS domain-containing protein n=1 Tax=bioreactor metagenome TaxID=1076179 RepID=A0A644T839_9ZZZZ|nr:hypothetical protein [Lentimicrobium sp.]MEA5109325.1 hypothetical protein [Lentimicrobium sp.]
MKITGERYQSYSLCREMYETIGIVRNFDPHKFVPLAEELSSRDKLLLAGEGSSRIFPAMNAISQLLKNASNKTIITEGCLQAMEYNLDDFAVIGLSNSGRTRELLNLFGKLRQEKHDALYSVTAFAGSPVTGISRACVLGCGPEGAVAATKSVVEQALILQVLTSFYAGDFSALNDDFKIAARQLADELEYTLSADIETDIIEAYAGASKVYFAGRNNGVAEELALKANEITRKKSVYLGGTFLLHGIEEVMDAGEIVILVDPWQSEEEKIRQVICHGAGLKVFAISSRQTSFPTILVPDSKEFQGYIQLIAGWNLLVEAGLYMGINIDKGMRARKIGNEG